MSVSFDTPTPAAEVLGAVRGLAPAIAARAGEIEAARRVPGDLVEDLVAAGCFRMLLPRSHGGAGLDLPSALRVVEELTRADASAGWVVMLGASAWIDLSRLPRETFDAVFADRDVVVGGVFSPSGVAVPDDGGYRVSGRWAFASGCEHCRWVYGNCIEEGGETPRMRMALFAPAEIEIEDTWSVSGLCGTGSHHYVADGVLVPADRTLLPLSDAPCVDEPLVRIPPPAVFALGVAGAAIGIAQGALDDIVALAATKVPLLARAPLAANALFQHQLAEADTTLRAARGLLHADAAAAWGTATSGAPFTPDQRARIRSTAVWATASAASVVDTAYGAGGGSSPYTHNPLQRRLRDIHVLTQHFLVRPDTLCTAGAVLAGQEVDLTIF